MYEKQKYYYSTIEPYVIVKFICEVLLFIQSIFG